MDGSREARLRGDLDAVVRSALAAVRPEDLVRRALEGGAPAVPPTRGGAEPDVIILAVGKAAVGMALGARAALGSRVRGGVVLAPHWTDAPGDRLRPLRVFRGGHPLPDREGVRGATALMEAAREAGSDDTLLFLLSGGGSALLTLPPPGVALEDVREVTRLLLRSGADIRELNTVRKHLDRLKGGGLARAAAPTPIRAAVISDVVGDPLDVIASGPVSPDPTTFSDALAVLERRTEGRAPDGALRHLVKGAEGRVAETPGPGDPCFRNVEARIVGNVATAVEGARRRAVALGYDCRLLGTDVTGEARRVGRVLGRLARRERKAAGAGELRCLLAGGEATVTVTGDGRGGRNQEVALGAAAPIAGLEGVLVAAVGTDGVDGPTDAAGALVTGATLERARMAGLDPAEALARNDADRFFRGLDDRLVTGPTGTNVMDLHVVLVRG